MNTLTLKKSLETFLKTKADRVYQKKAPETKTFPYVVWNLISSDSGYSEAEDFILEIDIWDDKRDTTTIDTLVGIIDGDGDIKAPSGLHRKNIFIESILSAKIYRQNRYEIHDEDETLERRQLRYKMKTYLLG
ncbi:MAG: hypothetical protein PHP92_05455 [Candidatus Nanoarchaeia archaeon]|jgi:hypothetical protein|nr:hypothetical protein [Candidatus Nanoarchaeia archaeon]